MIQTCVFKFIPWCWKSLNLWTFILTSDPEAQSTHMNTHSLSTSPRPPAGILQSCGCVHLFTFTLIILTWLTVYLHFHLHHAVFGTTPRFKMFLFFVYAISCHLHFILFPQSSLPLFLLGYKTHPPIPWTCWHTNTVFRKQNIPGNMTGIWKCLISLDGWVSNPQANEQGRERGTERETVEEHCSFCQGQMVRAALVLHAPSACQAMTRTQHTHGHSYLSLFVQQ